jgi:AcrR family transcriptional regulator
MTERSLRDQRREHRRALSRDQILDAAEQVFARHGFHDASLREIAELAEYSVGAVYGFFTGKEDIYREIFRRRAAEFLPGMREVLGSPAAPLRQLLDLAAWQVGFFRRYPHFGRLVLREGAIASPLATPADAQHQKNFATAQLMQADLFGRGQQAGELRPGPPAVLARMFSGLVSAFQAAELAAGPEWAEPGAAEPGAAEPGGKARLEGEARLEDLLAVVEAAFAAR